MKWSDLFKSAGINPDDDVPTETPPESPPADPPADDKDSEIAKLKAQLAEAQKPPEDPPADPPAEDPRDAEIARLKAEIEAAKPKAADSIKPPVGSNNAGGNTDIMKMTTDEINKAWNEGNLQTRLREGRLK